LFLGKGGAKAADFYRAVIDHPERSGSFNQAVAYAILGRKPEALAALRAACDHHEVMMALVASEPAFASLHGDPGFREIVRKLGL
jgi:hypothetical protein